MNKQADISEIHFTIYNDDTTTNYPTERKKQTSMSEVIEQSAEKENVDSLSNSTIDQISLEDIKTYKRIPLAEITLSKPRAVNRLINRKRPRTEGFNVRKPKPQSKPKPKNIIEDDSDIEANSLEDYSDKQYQRDLQLVLEGSAKHRFMYANFPCTYDKIPFFLNIKPDYASEGNQVNLPKQITREALITDNKQMTSQCKWSPYISQQDMDHAAYDDFMKTMESQWDYNATYFNKELILEYIMNKGYDYSHCLSNITHCIDYVKSKQLPMIISPETRVFPKQMLRYKGKSYNLRDPKTKEFGHSVFNRDYYTYF